MPNALYNNPLLTVGRIELGGCGVTGHFGGYSNTVYRFSGKGVWGPARVTQPLQKFIDEWNELSSPLCDEEDEHPRQLPSPEASLESTEPTAVDSSSKSSTYPKAG